MKTIMPLLAALDHPGRGTLDDGLRGSGTEVLPTVKQTQA